MKKMCVASVYVIVAPVLTALFGYMDPHQDNADGKIVYGSM